MSTSADNYKTLFNGTTSVAHGELVRVSANKTFVRALADTAAHAAALIGSNGSGTVGTGGPAQIFSDGASIDILLETGLTPSAGNVVYLSALTAGRGTNVAPGIAAQVGVINDASQYARTGLVTVTMALFGSAGSSPLPVMVPGQIPFGITGGGLGQSANLTWDNTNQNMTITGNSVLGQPSLTLNAGGSGQSVTLEYASLGTALAKVMAFSVPSVVTTIFQAMFTANAIDGWEWTDSTFGVATGLIQPNRQDAGFGSFTTLAPGATSGFLYFPTWSGNPTGVPAGLSSFVNMAPHGYDAANNRLNIYNGGWKGIPAAAPIAAGGGSPVITTAPGAIVSLNAKWETYKDPAGVTSYRMFFQ